MMTVRPTSSRQIALFSLVVLTTAFVAAVMFAGFRPGIIRLGTLEIPALQVIFAGLALPVLAVFGLPGRSIPALCYGGAAIALVANGLWFLTSAARTRSFGSEILHAALVACALGIAARGWAAARGERATPLDQRT